jgi:serine protease
MKEYPAYNFGAARVFGVEPAMYVTRFKLALGAALAVLLGLLGALVPGGAGAAHAHARARASSSPGQAHAIAEHHRFAPRQLVVKFEGEAHGRTVGLPRGVSVLAAARALRAKPNVEYAQPNYVAHASAAEEPEPFDPDDPGTLEPGATSASTPGGWALRQWDFLNYTGTATAKLPTSPGGINAVGAWANLEAEGRPGAKGITVAVLDSGIAYRNSGTQYVRSPDFSPSQFVAGINLVGPGPYPLDQNGHGTFVAATIAEQTNNGVGLTGLAYNAKLMPVRVLGRENEGFANKIAEGIHFAIKHGAKVINMSFNFECGAKVPQVDEALREAYAHGVVTVASGGNLSDKVSSKDNCVSEPATGPRVIGVGGTTEGACMGSYSLAGKGIDVVAPGGGTPAAGCPSVLARPIYQVTLKKGTTNEFAIPTEYDGTSMAAAHVSGVAAMILASGVIPKGLTPKAKVRAVTKRLKVTARSLGYPKTQQGAGLIDAARATAP